LTDFHGDEAKKKKSEWPTHNMIFFLSQFSIFFRQNFRDWLLVEYHKLMQRASMWLTWTYMVISLSDVSSKKGKNTQNAFLALF
jgi:hypothetical protein